jgi:hypothetical protein
MLPSVVDEEAQAGLRPLGYQPATLLQQRLGREPVAAAKAKDMALAKHSSAAPDSVKWASSDGIARRGRPVVPNTGCEDLCRRGNKVTDRGFPARLGKPIAKIAGNHQEPGILAQDRRSQPCYDEV